MSPKFRLSMRIIAAVLVIFALLNAALLVLQTWPMIQTGQSPLLNLLGTKTIKPLAEDEAARETPAPQAQESPLAATQTPVALSAMTIYENDVEGLAQDGMVILAMRDGFYSHLFAYHPLYLSLTRITDGNWDDRAPAVSPDGTKIAFASRQNGFWDLYILSVVDGSLVQITDTKEYDGAPSWSPDGQWLAYETYVTDNLEIAVRSITDLNQSAILLTDNPGLDSTPAWSPLGRVIAFTSDRDGNLDIWQAQLDQADNRYTNISRTKQGSESNPEWSHDGRYLAWASESEGNSQVKIWDSQNPEAVPQASGVGHDPTWSADGTRIITVLNSPNVTTLVGYPAANASLLYPPLQLRGTVYGLDWHAGSLPQTFAQMPLSEDATEPAAALYQVNLSESGLPGGRTGIVQISDLDAPYPFLSDRVDEAYYSLREKTGQESGWDFLASLEQAYFPLTEPPQPGAELNWLMTGRAIAVNPLPVGGGWMVTVKEEFEGQVYWRVYLKARQQDGSQGAPLTQLPWDNNARYLGDPVAYENGGKPGNALPGYWVDFTELANLYGWQRLPALSDWRTYYPSIRFNQFILSGGIDWQRAMEEVYPYEALITATYVPTPTPTFTPLPTETATATPTATLIPSPTTKPTITLTLSPTP